MQYTANRVHAVCMYRRLSPCSLTVHKLQAADYTLGWLYTKPVKQFSLDYNPIYTETIYHNCDWADWQFIAIENCTCREFCFWNCHHD